MARRRSSDAKRTSDRRHSWLVVLVACSGFAVASMQPPIVVAGEAGGQLVSAFGPNFEMPRNEAEAYAWLAESGFLLEGMADEELASDGDADAGRSSDLTDQRRAERRRRTDRTVRTTVPETPESTITTDRATTSIPSTSSTVAAPPTSVPTTSPSSTQQAEQRFVELINVERAAAGIPALTVNGDISAVARAWSEERSQSADECRPDELQHNPDYAGQMPPGWFRVAENVGCGQSADSLHQSFMDSPGHRDNIMDPDFTDVGIGVRFADDGAMWVTQNFAGY